MTSIIGGIVGLGRLEGDLTKKRDRKESDQKKSDSVAVSLLCHADGEAQEKRIKINQLTGLVMLS